MEQVAFFYEVGMRERYSGLLSRLPYWHRTVAF